MVPPPKKKICPNRSGTFLQGNHELRPAHPGWNAKGTVPVRPVSQYPHYFLAREVISCSAYDPGVFPNIENRL